MLRDGAGRRRIEIELPYLARAGHEVVVVDRQRGPALETSFANAGGITRDLPALGRRRDCRSWHAGCSRATRRSCCGRGSIRTSGAGWRASCVTAAPNASRATRRACSASPTAGACLGELIADTHIAFDHGAGGVLQLFRTEEELAGEQSARVLAEFGVAHRVIDAQEVLAIEPALRTAAVKLAGGLHLPGDETGGCHKFTAALAELLHQRVVFVRHDRETPRLEAQPRRGRRHRWRHARGRCLCRRARQRGGACCAAGHRPSDPSGEGLLPDHRPRRACRRRTVR